MSELNFKPAAGDDAAAVEPTTVPSPKNRALGNGRGRVGRHLRQQHLRLHRARVRFHDQRYRLFRTF